MSTWRQKNMFWNQVLESSYEIMCCYTDYFMHVPETKVDHAYNCSLSVIPHHILSAILTEYYWCHHIQMTNVNLTNC